MNETYAKKVKEKLDVVTVARDDFDTLVKDRLDFGIKSICLLYSEAINELAVYKAKADHEDPTLMYNLLNKRKRHFYEALRQLVYTHEEV